MTDNQKQAIEKILKQNGLSVLSYRADKDFIRIYLDGECFTGGDIDCLTRRIERTKSAVTALKGINQVLKVKI